MTGEAPSPAWPRRIGILGGLGPFAHLTFERLLLEVALHYGRGQATDQDYPPWLLVSIPQAPDRTAALLHGGPSPIESLVDGLQMLAPADFAIMVCNTAHWYLAELRRRSAIPILDVVEETVSRLVLQPAHGPCAGLLGTSGTIATGLYQRAAARRGASLAFLTPSELNVGGRSGADVQDHYVTELIYGGPDELDGGIKGGGHLRPGSHEVMQERFRVLLNAYVEAGIEQVVLGCTELSVAFGQVDIEGIRLIDPLRVAAEAAVAIASGRRALPGCEGRIA